MDLKKIGYATKMSDDLVEKLESEHLDMIVLYDDKIIYNGTGENVTYEEVKLFIEKNRPTPICVKITKNNTLLDISSNYSFYKPQKSDSQSWNKKNRRNNNFFH